ncbi:glycosyltransferase family 4 protein [Nisaea denitrificans]|uniref:glycosyltransferase family 4 protein n=1 Tax=Nisaea denitrificans TaxID=390877 RepID=UPI00041D51C7|nr:glycosyltransferase family 4 protein [Nisaea denitrificans]
METRQISRPTWQLLDSSAIGGIETHVLGLAQAQREAGRQTKVVFLADHGVHPLRDRLDRAGIPWRCLPGSMKDLVTAIAEEQPALVHTHGYKANIFGRIACRRTGTPLVSTFHNGDTGTGKVRLYTLLDRLSAPLGKAVAVNQDIAARIFGGAEVVPNGVRVPGKCPPRRGREIAFVGRLSHEKGPDLLCEIARGLPDLTFSIYGDGAMSGSLEAIAPANVTFHGAVEDLDRRWPGIGLLVMPSRAEGLPMAALEAMTQGVPVAAFDVGALRQLTDAGRGWCAPPEDTGALRDAIRTWSHLEDGERDTIGEQCWEYVRHECSADRLVQRLEAVYRLAAA